MSFVYGLLSPRIPFLKCLSFLATLWPMELLGLRSDPCGSCILCHSRGNARSFNPLLQAKDQTGTYTGACDPTVGFLSHWTTVDIPEHLFLIRILLYRNLKQLKMKPHGCLSGEHSRKKKNSRCKDPEVGIHTVIQGTARRLWLEHSE